MEAQILSRRQMDRLFPAEWIGGGGRTVRPGSGLHCCFGGRRAAPDSTVLPVWRVSDLGAQRPLSVVYRRQPGWHEGLVAQPDRRRGSGAHPRLGMAEPIAEDGRLSGALAGR